MEYVQIKKNVKTIIFTKLQSFVLSDTKMGGKILTMKRAKSGVLENLDVI